MRVFLKKVFLLVTVFLLLSIVTGLHVASADVSLDGFKENLTMLEKIKPQIASQPNTIADKPGVVQHNDSNSKEVVRTVAADSTSNLFVNGDFEMNPSTNGTWEFSYGTSGGIPSFVWDNQTYHGYYGRSIQITGTTSVNAYCVNSVPITPWKVYSFKAWGKALNVAAGEGQTGSFIYFGQYDSNGKFISNTGHLYTGTSATFDWNQIDCNIVAAPNAASFFLILGLEGSGTVWYDDVSLTALSDTPITPDCTLLPANAVITDTAIDPSNPVLYAVDNANSKLYAVNYVTKSISSITFALKPERIVYKSNKLYITLLKMQHDSYIQEEQQTGAVVILNAADFSLVKQIDVLTDPFDIDVTGDNIFLSSGSGQWTNISSYSVTSGQLISSYSIYERSFIELNPSMNRIYAVDTNVSPRDYEAYDFNNGIFTGSYDSPYHGDYPMNVNSRISPDGKYIFNGSGLILSCDTVKAKDMQYTFKLDNSFSDIAFNLEANTFYTSVSGKKIYSYDYNSYIGTFSFNTSGDVNNLYYQGGKLVTLSKLGDSQYIVEMIDANSGAAITPSSASDIQLQKSGTNLLLNYLVADSVKDPNNSIIYISDKANKKIASINYATGIARELNTFYSPGCIAYYNGELYVGYGDQGFIEIFNAQSLELKDRIFTKNSFFDLAIGNDGFIYTTSNDYARSYSRTSKSEVSKIWVFEKGYLEVHPILNTLYFTSLYVSPADVYALRYSNGVLTQQYDSPYHGDYSMRDLNKVSPDGRYIFNSSGLILTSDADKTKDLRFSSQLSQSFSDIAFDSQNNIFYTALVGKMIYSYNYNSLAGISSISSAGEVKDLYYVNNQLIAISLMGTNQYIIEKINVAAGYDASKVTSLVLTTDKASPQQTGTEITLTATANINAEYQFFVQSPGADWTPIAGYSISNTCKWTPQSAGTYGLGVRARAAGTSVIMDMDKTMNFVVTPASSGPVTSLNLTTNKASSQPAGTTITLTATADKAAEYQFFVQSPGGSWTAVNSFSTSNTYSWTPTSAGTYGLGVRVRAAGTSVIMDLDKTINFVVTPASSGPVTSLSLTTDKASPQPAGTTITLTATADKAAEYQFFVLSPGGSWTAVNSFSTSNTYSWTPTSAGTYGLGVRARAAGTSVIMDMDKTINFVVTPASSGPVTSLNLTTDKASSQPAGTTITLTATADKIAEYQFFVLSPGGSWTAVNSFSISNTYSWTPTSAGTYGLGVRARAAGTSVIMDMDKTMNFVVTPAASGPVTSLSLATDKASPQPAGTTITLTATADKTAEYQFFVLSPGGSWTAVNSYSTSNTYTWTPTSAGTYGLGVRARAAGTSVIMDMDKTMNFVVTPSSSGPVTSLNLTTDKASSQPAGTTITLTATADKAAEYQFFVLSPGGAWTAVTGFSTNNTYSWTPASAGIYGLGVRARAVGTSVIMDMDKTMNFVVTSAPSGPVTSLNLTTDKASSQPAGTTITLTATADKAAEFQFFILTPGGGWTAVTGFSANNTYTWTPTTAGVYGLGVRARAAGTSVIMDMDKTMNFVVN